MTGYGPVVLITTVHGYGLEYFKKSWWRMSIVADGFISVGEFLIPLVWEREFKAVHLFG